MGPKWYEVDSFIRLAGRSYFDCYLGTPVDFPDIAEPILARQASCPCDAAVTRPWSYSALSRGGRTSGSGTLLGASEHGCTRLFPSSPTTMEAAMALACSSAAVNVA